MMGVRPVRSDSGFTLLEVLVAVVIMAVIMTTAFGALRLGGRSWEAGIARADGNATYRAVADLLRRQVSQILPLTWPEASQGRIAFDGEPTRLRFIAPAPQQRSEAGLFEYGLSAERQGLEIKLVLSYIPFNPDAEAFQTPAPHQQALLVEQLEGVSFDYFGSPAKAGIRGNSTNQAPRWYRRWAADAQNLPQLIRVRMAVKEGQRPWPELHLPLPAGHQP